MNFGKTASALPEEKLESPLEFIQKRFRRRTSLYDTEERISLKPQQVFPILIVLVILASSVFTIMLLKGAVTR